MTLRQPLYISGIIVDSFNEDKSYLLQSYMDWISLMGLMELVDEFGKIIKGANDSKWGSGMRLHNEMRWLP